MARILVTDRASSRSLGVIARIDTRDRGYVFITGEDQIEYFAHATGFDDAGWFDQVAQGDGVSFRIARTGKGFRAFAIQPARSEELIRLQAMEERRGNI